MVCVVLDWVWRGSPYGFKAVHLSSLTFLSRIGVIEIVCALRLLGRGAGELGAGARGARAGPHAGHSPL